MRALTAAAVLCVLTACSTGPTRAPVSDTPKVQTTAEALAEARAKNQHWLDPALIKSFPESGAADYRPPATLAVLLPQSGNLAVAGNAIRDGLLAAYYAETRSKPGIRFYDTQGNAAGAKAAFDRAVKEGAQMIIGPIGKDEVAAIHDAAGDIPVLALNRLDAPSNRHVLNFSLSPEREGELIAERLLGRGLLQTAVFSQGSDSNSRMLAAFEKRYQSGGGSVLLKAPAPVFGKDAAGAAVNPVLPDAVREAKAVLLLMNGDAAKPTRAALALNGAGGIPVFAGTDITDSSDAKTNSQLDGIEFLQMPWLVNRGNSLNISAAQLLKLPSARGPGAKLNAFGADAWLIATRLPVWLASPNSEIAGATGSLHLEPDGRIERSLPWSVFRAGIPQAVNGP
ncbi:MAG: penicillin-binding protein activator [Arenimonas sp.]|uniref:penicillin-binding protein activator n=1 Tax=Arenimonas sp. TaxID=1872635 RepID=UPI003C001825